MLNYTTFILSVFIISCTLGNTVLADEKTTVASEKPISQYVEEGVERVVGWIKEKKEKSKKVTLDLPLSSTKETPSAYDTKDSSTANTSAPSIIPDALKKFGKQALNMSPKRKTITPKPAPHIPREVWQKARAEFNNMTKATASEWTAKKARYGTSLKSLVEKSEATYLEISKPLYGSLVELESDAQDIVIHKMTSHLTNKTVEWAISGGRSSEKDTDDEAVPIGEQVAAYTNKIFNINPDRAENKN
ncbi:MAG: hypothetical protein OQK35_03460, partial [Alphaproteobacteria bacterium]|nr:hypothetical protein [Alphaproteobacteria bacterium]